MPMGEEYLIMLIFAFIISFVPSIIYTVMIRFTEKYEREPWASVWMAFLWGATICVIFIIIVKGWYITEMSELRADAYKYSIILYCFLIPFAAESIKPIGLVLIKRDLDEAEDGLVYGAAIGLGFAAADTLLYGVFQVINFDITVFVSTVLLRSLSVVLLHAAATSITGYGISRGIAQVHGSREKIWAFPLFILAAMFMHGIFNYLVILSNYNAEDPSLLLRNPLKYGVSNMMLAIGFAVLMMIIIYVKIYRLDRIEERERKKLEKELKDAAMKGPAIPPQTPAPPQPQRPPQQMAYQPQPPPGVQLRARPPPPQQQLQQQRPPPQPSPQAQRPPSQQQQQQQQWVQPRRDADDDDWLQL